QTAKPSGLRTAARGALAARGLPNRGQSKAPEAGAAWGAAATAVRGVASLAVRNPPPKPATSSATPARTAWRPPGIGISAPRFARVFAPRPGAVNRGCVSARGATERCGGRVTGRVSTGVYFPPIQTGYCIDSQSRRAGGPDVTV